MSVFWREFLQMANVENLATHWFPLFQPYFLGVRLSIGGRVPLDSPSDLGILREKRHPSGDLRTLELMTIYQEIRGRLAVPPRWTIWGIRWCPMDFFGAKFSTKFSKLWGYTQPVVFFKKPLSGWWFQICFIFIPTWGRFPFWLILFRWVETTNQLSTFGDYIFFLGKN